MPASTDPRDRAIQALTWDYPTEGATADPVIDAVVKEINGWTVADRKQVKDFTALKDDGSTACGCWIYSGIYPDEGHEPGARPPRRRLGQPGLGLRLARQPAHPLQPGQRRPAGPPLVRAQKYIWWDAEKGEVDRLRRARLPARQSARHPRRPRRQGHGRPFRQPTRSSCMADGKGWLFVPDRPERRPAAHALRAGGRPGAQRALQPADQPDGQSLAAARQPADRARRPAISLCHHHLPPDRASHGGRHDPLAALATLELPRLRLRPVPGARRRRR